MKSSLLAMARKRKDVIGSISTISSEDLIKATSAASFDAALQGLAPGLMVSNESGIPGSPVQIKVRGINSISSGTNPLWIVDGIPIASTNLGSSFNGESSQNVMSMINPADIESIQVLKDAAATSNYCYRGYNGVIRVTTKSGKREHEYFGRREIWVSNWANRDIGLTGPQYIEIMDKAYANSKFRIVTRRQPQSTGWRKRYLTRAGNGYHTDWGDVM